MNAARLFTTLIATLCSDVFGPPASTAPIPESARDPNFTLRIATVQAGQSHYATGNPGLETNFSALVCLAREAATHHPDLIVFPEYAISGWPYPKEKIINGLAEPIPGESHWYRRYRDLGRQQVRF